jgi:hypothetical protein
LLSGRRLDWLDPSPLEIEMEDGAHGLPRRDEKLAKKRGRAHYVLAEWTDVKRNRPASEVAETLWAFLPILWPMPLADVCHAGQNRCGL